MIKEEKVDKLKELVEDINVTMMTTVDAKGALHSRPMATAKVEDNGDIWFFTNEYSAKVGDIENKENVVNLAYASPSGNTYVSICGHASVVDDKKKVEELWSPIMKAWFPEGKDDPKLALIKVDPDSVQYWDGSSSKLVQLFNIGRAIFTGQHHSSVSNAENKTFSL